MRWVFGVVGVALSVASACSEDPQQAPSGKPDAGTDATTDATSDAPQQLRDQKFAGFEPWASPIDDYLAIGEASYPGDFNRAIVDLAPFGAKLFIGYGDATRNLGEKTPIEFRFFASAADPEAQAALVDGAGQGAPQTTPQQSGEEQIDRYRVLDGAIWQAGIDSIDADELHTQANTDPKGIQGNVYRLEGDVWKKYRSVNGGEHVHDVMSWQGAIYAVGSGADTRTEFEAGQVFRYLWKSTDQGKTFQTAKRVEVQNAGQGDTRWVTLLPTAGALYLFGYESVFATSTSSLRNASWDGTSVVDLPVTHSLGKLYATSTLPLSDGTCLLFGLDVSAPPVKSTAGRVAADGTFTALASFAGSTVLDAALTDTGEVLYLAIAGDQADPQATSFDVRVLVAAITSPDATSELLHFTTDVRPVSLAHFQGALFLGTNEGKVLKAVPTGG